MITKSHKLQIVHIVISGIVCLVLSADAAARDWFVRPTGGDYGSEDGTSYANAWDGLENVVWGETGVVGGDTLYVCGVHIYPETPSSSLQTKVDITVSGNDENLRIIIRGDYPGDPGIIWGNYITGGPNTSWTYQGDNTYSCASSYTRGYFYFENVSGTWDLLTKVNSVADCKALPGSYYSETYRYPDPIYFHCSDNGNPNLRVSTPTVGYVICLNDQSYITFLNIDFYQVNFHTDNAHHIKWEGCKLWYMPNGFCLWDTTSYCEIIDCDRAYGLGGISFQDKRPRGENAPHHMIIRNCEIHDIGIYMRNEDAEGIGTNGVEDLTIENNEFYNCGTAFQSYPYSGSTSKNIIIRWNYVHDSHQLGGARGTGIAIGTDPPNTADMSGNQVYGNIVANCSSYAYESNFDLYEVVFYNNVAYNCKYSFFFNAVYRDDNGPKIVFKNNISISPVDQHIYFGSVTTEDNYSLDSDYNLFYPDILEGFGFKGKGYAGNNNFAGWQALSRSGCTFDPHSIIADPLFVDPQNANFAAANNSLAIDAGIDVGLTQDFQGKPVPQGSAPDIGAYEFTLNAVTDLAVSGTSQNSVTFSWTMPSDDGLASMPSRYDIRYATSLITEANWSTATQVQGEPAPEDFGVGRTFTISGLIPGTTYYIAIKTSNETGSTSSPLSNVISQTTTTSGNSAPVLAPIGDKSVENNQLLTFTINATDADAGDTLTYSATDLPAGATFTDQTFNWTPTDSQGGIYHVTFQVTDGSVAVTETIRIAVNGAPVLAAIGNKSVSEGSTLSFTISATDPEGDAITYSATGLPAGAAFGDRTFSWTPGYTQAGTYNVTFAASDGIAQDSETITITVNNNNRAPVLDAIGDKSAYTDVPLTFTVDANDPDGEAITYSATGLPAGATFTGRDFDWTPAPAQTGAYDITFYASDGQLQDSEAITITVDVDDLAPAVTNCSPAADSIQVPLNNLVALNVTDAGIGVNADTVKIKVRINNNSNDDTIYFGDTDHYTSLLGDCRRIGGNASYQFVFQPTQDLFYHDQTITITVNAADLAGNVMNEYSYSFVTEMHLFGRNKLVNTDSENSDRPVTVCDSGGNIWAAWHTGLAGGRDIYIGKLASGADSFGNIVRLTSNAADQCNPAIALDSNDKLYAVWQDSREGDWDIYISTSVDGINWSAETRVNDPNEGNQVNPAIVVDGRSPNYAYVVWQDDRAGNQDICIAASSDGFITKTVSQITSDTADQTTPAITADSANTIYVVWTDSRNGSGDIYGAASNNSWTNAAVVSNANNQSSPVIAAESTGSILHFLWVDDTPGDNDIYYASSNNGLPGSPLTGVSIIDDTSGSDQLEPAISVTGAAGTNDLKVFACWQDWRNTDTDLYFTELNTGSGTNVFVNDGGSNAYQGEPAVGVNEYDNPYLIWADDRNTSTDIYYTGSTCLEPAALASASVSASAAGITIVGVDPQTITDVDDVSIVLPPGACLYDVDITITPISNQQIFAVPCLGGYDFGPSGIQFNQPVTITIPYIYANSNGSTVPYWFNSLTGTLSQQGITNIRDITISPTLHAISFETTHFTPFYLLGGGDAAAVLGGGGGGCSVSAGSEGNIVEFALPYVALALFMFILKWRDRRYKEDFEEILHS